MQYGPLRVEGRVRTNGDFERCIWTRDEYVWRVRTDEEDVGRRRTGVEGAGSGQRPNLVRDPTSLGSHDFSTESSTISALNDEFPSNHLWSMKWSNPPTPSKLIPYCKCAIYRMKRCNS